MFKKSIYLISILCILTNNAYANGGPVVIDSTGGYHIIPSDDNNIQILKEDIVYNLDDKNKDSEGRFKAQVDISYIMKNTNTEVEEYYIAFPLNQFISESNPDDVTVTFDGNEIDVEILILQGSMDDTVSSDIYNTSKTIQEEVSFQEIVSKLKKATKLAYYRSSYNNFRIAIFNIAFQPNSEHVLKVSYYEHSRITRERRFLYSYTEWMPEFSYYLEPAKYWNSFKDLSITINVPEGYYIDTNTIKEFEQDNNKHSYYSDVLPDINLRFSLEKKTVKIGNDIVDLLMLKSFGQFILICFGILVIGYIFLLWLQHNKRKKWKDKYRKF